MQQTKLHRRRERDTLQSQSKGRCSSLEDRALMANPLKSMAKSGCLIQQLQLGTISSHPQAQKFHPLVRCMRLLAPTNLSQAQTSLSRTCSPPGLCLQSSKPARLKKTATAARSSSTAAPPLTMPGPSTCTHRSGDLYLLRLPTLILHSDLPWPSQIQLSTLSMRPHRLLKNSTPYH